MHSISIGGCMVKRYTTITAALQKLLFACWVRLFIRFINRVTIPSAIPACKAAILDRSGYNQCFLLMTCLTFFIHDDH